MNLHRIALVAPSLLLALASATAQPRPATDATRAVQQAARAALTADDRLALADARRGLVEDATDLVVDGPGGRPIWRLRDYDFLQREDAPDTVNPALWKHARLNLSNGLFQVTERMYQLRGLDLSNMTIVEGDTGLIVIDPLLSVETARAGLALYFKHRPRKPVVAVVYTHSHADHFGGVRGVVDEAEVKAGRVQVIAPTGFLEEAVGENVIAGPAMSRRAHYQFGALLPRGERGQVDAGLGKAGPPGTVSLIAPTRLIAQPVERLRIDGVDIVFALAQGTEAPAEMVMHFPQWRVLNMAEVVTQNLHNLLPMRGAQVRDALAWSHQIGEALQRFGGDSDILVAQHHWPTWGRERIQSMLRKQRDAYKFVHDQSVRLMNLGVPADEAAERIQLPPSLAAEWSTQPFYGHLKHNVRAVYQRYLGYYDGNPTRLEALPAAAAARKAVEYMGGADAVLKRARDDFARGEYRWVAQVASQLVYADPSNPDARGLAADAYEQLGYQQQSATARNAFLQGAAELRDGVPRLPARGPQSSDLARALPLDLFFDFLGVRLNADKAQGKRIVLNWRFTDTGEEHLLNLENSALTHVRGAQDPQAHATLTLSRATLDDIAQQRIGMLAALQSGAVRIDGSPLQVAALFGMLDNFDRVFPLVEPAQPVR
jgi:alkyl sulfatase BDS1-like metallo-beta-lactamase superfamily hydrolase